MRAAYSVSNPATAIILGGKDGSLTLKPIEDQEGAIRDGVGGRLREVRRDAGLKQA